MRLPKMNLAGAWLPGAELTFDRLHQVNLEEANLQDAVLRHADLTGARLSDADLVSTGLQRQEGRCLSSYCFYWYNFEFGTWHPHNRSAH